MAFATLRSRLLALCTFWALLLCVLAGVALTRLQSLRDSLDTVYQDRLVCQVQLRGIADIYGRHLVSMAGRFGADLLDARAALAQLDAQQQQAALLWTSFKGTTLVPAEKSLVEQAGPLLARADAALAVLRQQVQQGDRAGVQAWVRRDMPSTLGPFVQVIDQLFDVQQRVAAAELQRARQDQQRTVLSLLVLMTAGLGLGGALTWALVSHHTRRAREDERALRRMNDFYTALSRTNQLIVRGLDEHPLLQQLCSICTETGHAVATTVFLLDGDQATRVATAGPSAAFFEAMPAHWGVTDPAYRQSVTALALFTGLHRVGRVTVKGSAEAWRAQALAHGIQAIAAFPIRRSGRVHGVLSLYAGEADFFDGPLVKLLAEIAADVSFALDNLEREAARAQQRQLTQQALQRFQTLFQAAPVACAIVTVADATVLEVNDEMCRRYNARREDVIGSSRGRMGTMMVKEDGDRYRECLARDGRIHNMEVRTQRPGGRMGTVIINAETLEYQGQPCVMVMALDITDLRDADDARRAQAQAEAANREKTAFLSRMSHELRTPLNAMLGFTQLMQRDAHDRLLAQDITQLEHIRQAGWHLLALVNDVMDVSRIESGHFAVTATALPLNGLLDEALRLTQVAAQGRGITLEAAYRDQAAATVLADPVRLRQVLINLLSNAVKYNRDGGLVQVRVWVSSRTAGEQVTIEITDTGIGMSDEQLQHLYEPFNRLGRERGGIEGTGLGLALTRQLVGLMDGEMGFESRVGVGTTARLMLPAAAPETVPGQGPSGTVLYVEDNEINVMVIEQMLRQWSGVRFVHAGDGASGFERAARLQPDLVLLDMQLPDMDGFELLKRLRADARTVGLLVVALSADDAPEDVQRALDGGAAGYWTKPVNLQTFLRDVATHLGAKAGR